MVNLFKQGGDFLFTVKKNANWVNINDEIFISTGNYLKVNMVLIREGNEVAIIDAGKDDEEVHRILEFIENNQLKVTHFFLTHYHNDHIHGLEKFKKNNVKFYDFANTEDHQIVTMGDKSFRILHTKGHAEGEHICIELNNRILIAGDIVFTNLLPGLPYGGNSKELIVALEKLREQNYSLIIPGHGDIAENDISIRQSITYLKNARKEIRKLIESNGDSINLSQIKIEHLIEPLDGYNYMDFPFDIHEHNIEKIYNELL